MIFSLSALFTFEYILILQQSHSILLDVDPALVVQGLRRTSPLLVWEYGLVDVWRIEGGNFALSLQLVEVFGDAVS